MNFRLLILAIAALGLCGLFGSVKCVHGCGVTGRQTSNTPKPQSTPQSNSKQSDEPRSSATAEAQAPQVNGVSSQSGESQRGAIVVADRALTGPHSLPEQRGARMFLPAVSIARALGDSLTIDIVARSVKVQRQTGVVAEFNAQRNQIFENGAVVMVVSDTADIVLPPNAEELMLPVEILSPLLDVSIIVDQSTHTVRITRGQSGAEPVRAGAQQADWEIYKIDYSSNLNFYSSSFNHNLALHSIGRIKDGRFDFLSNIDGGTNQGPLVFRRSLFTFERENGQRLMGGDFGTGNDLEFLSAAIRGVSIQQPFENMRVTLFGGRALSDVTQKIGLTDPFTGLPLIPVEPPKPHYDTNVAGAFATFGATSQRPASSKLVNFSTGLMYFNGPNATGEMITSSLRYSSARNQFQGDVGAGNFSGLTPQGVDVHGFAPMLDVSELFNLSESFTFRGRYSHIGSNFLSPQAGGLFTPMNLISGGVNWRATQWLSASLTGTSRESLAPPSPISSSTPSLNLASQSDRSITATLSVTPRGFWPTMSFTHTQGSNSLTGANAYTLFNATKEFKKWRLFGNFTRIQNGQFLTVSTPGAVISPPSLNTTFGAMVRIGESHTLQVSQSIGSGKTLGGAFDWMTSSFFTKRVMFGAGLGYSTSRSQVSLVERALATVQLPFQQTLQVSYVNTPTGAQLVAQLRGNLLQSRRATAAQNAAVADIRSFGVLSGKVYQDINLNGRFDPGVDKPQEGVQVRVDGNYYEVTDRNGDFKVDNVKAGQHLVYLDLLTVRADLTLLTSAQHAVTLNSGRDLIVDFRLVRTGRMTGTVWMDLNGNGRIDDGEQLLADVRVVTGSGRDTLTDAQGQFVLGDLPPGEHVVMIDEKTLPENKKSAAGSLRVNIDAGGETSNVNFPIVARPAEVNVKHFAPEQKP
jgi:hypothetical protein